MSNLSYSNILGLKGVLAKHLPSFQPRPQQISMAEAVDEAIQSKAWLIAEAATGTGKTFAYLVPALLSGKKILLATATKTLQDQLVVHDLPRIIATLGLSRTVQNLKGRDNYLCKYHIQRILSESHAKSNPYFSDVMKIYEQLPSLTVGEKSEIRHIPQDAVFWHGLTAHADNCLASKCPMLAECFMYKARQKAMAADCVVVNHHLFFADSRLKSEGFGALLPAFEVFVFDEAHQLMDVATQYYSHSFSTAQMSRLLLELEQASVFQTALAKQCVELNESLQLFLQQAQSYLQSVDIRPLIRKGQLPLLDWLQQLRGLLTGVEGLAIESDLAATRWVSRLETLIFSMQRCCEETPTGIAWLQPLKKHIRFQWSPFDISQSVGELLTSLSASLIFTSATLRTNQQFDWFQQALGLDAAKTAFWDSPYNWQKQSLMYIPHGLPDVYDEYYYDKFIDALLPIIEQLQGKTFILFTSHRALQWVAQQLPKRCRLPILVQGTDDKRVLLDTFRDSGHAILLGTGSFWEGVDVQGQALSCVAIDKLPFANIAEPLISAKLQYLQSQGKSSFDDFLIPQAIIALKQGLGRLLRTEQDKGVIVIGDPRLIGRPYGAQIRRSLPQMKWTRSLSAVKMFIESFEETTLEEIGV